MLDNDRLLYSKLISELLNTLPKQDQTQLRLLLEKVALKTIQSGIL